MRKLSRCQVAATRRARLKAMGELREFARLERHRRRFSPEALASRATARRERAAARKLAVAIRHKHSAEVRRLKAEAAALAKDVADKELAGLAP